MTRKPETWPEVGADQGGEERPLAHLSVDPNNLVVSLAEIVPSLPFGRSNYHFDERTNSLIPLPRNSRKDGVGINKKSGYVAIAGTWQIDYLTSDSTYLQMELNRDNSLEVARFSNGIHLDPAVSVVFEPKQGFVESRGHVHIPLVHQISSFSPDYTGDHQTLNFKGLNDYSPGQLALIFQGGNVPSIDIQRFIYESIFLGNEKALRNLPLPQLAFDRERDSYHPDHSRTYLVKPYGKLPRVEGGQIIEGVAIAERDDQPYRVSVALSDVKEVDHEYSNGKGKATTVFATTTISDGVHGSVTSNGAFTVRSDMKYLANHPELVPGTAFAELFNA